MPPIIDSLPILLVYALIVVIALGATEIGFQVGRYWTRRTGRKQESSPSSGIIAATLGLLAFILAFTTGIALNRFDNRRALVLEEANAIGTTYLRAGYLDEPVDSESRSLLAEYVDVRLQAVVPDQLEAAIQRSEEIQGQLWTMAETLAKAQPDSDVLAIYIESLNQMIDVHTKRLVAVEASRLPSPLWAEILLMTLLVMFLVGVGNGFDGRRNLLALTILALVFGAVILIIVDLDRTQGGFLKVSQQALIDLQRQLSGLQP